MFNNSAERRAWTAYIDNLDDDAFYDWINNASDRDIHAWAIGDDSYFGKFPKSDFNSKPKFGWNKKSGIQAFGKNLGKGANIVSGVYQGINAAKGLKDLSNVKADTSDIKSDIVTASYNNPMLQDDLNADQMKLLRQLQRSSYDSDASLSDVDLLGVLGNAALGGVAGLATGGVPGALIGAVGSGGNAVINNLTQAQNTTNSELEALYQAIMESEQQYNALKKQRMLQSGVYF